MIGCICALKLAQDWVFGKLAQIRALGSPNLELDSNGHRFVYRIIITEQALYLGN